MSIVLLPVSSVPGPPRCSPNPVLALEGANSPRGIHRGQRSGHGSPPGAQGAGGVRLLPIDWPTPPGTSEDQMMVVETMGPIARSGPTGGRVPASKEYRVHGRTGTGGGARRPHSGLRASTSGRSARPPAGSADDGGRAPVSRRRHVRTWRAGNRYAEIRWKGLAPAQIRTEVPGPPIRGAETRIVCVDAMEWMTRAGTWSRSIDVHRNGKLRHWRQRAREADGE